MTAPEFSRAERADAIGAGERHIRVAADAAERAALAKRFDLIAIDRLEGDFAVRRDAAGIVARGRVQASVIQACVATEAPVTSAIDEPVDLRFVEGEAAGEEIELSADDCDVVPYDGTAIDLGEVTAETMALALDPFPRAPAAEQALRDAGVLREEEAGPFGALAALRDKMGGKA